MVHFRCLAHMQTRRKFLRDCSLVALTASLAPAAALAQNHAVGIAGPDWAGFEQFARQVNTLFLVRTGSITVKLLLIEAHTFSAASPASEDAGNEKFSLRFQGPVQPPLEQGTYQFDHSLLGHLSIFIVPVGNLELTHCYYEAIFDRPVDAAEFAAQLARAPRPVQKH
jgi:hypothetical protein